MPSPFPGMNPYLERETIWHDFHETFVPALREQLVQQVVPRYFVKIEASVYVHELPYEERSFPGRPDVSITDSLRDVSPEGTAATSVDAPARARLLDVVDEERLSYLEIRDRKSRELVTAIELLSPSNKRLGSDRDQYLAKRHRLLAAGVNFVEIDLLRGVPRTNLEGLPECDYYVMVSRPEHRPDVGVWPVRLRDPLPTVSVPLRPADSDAQLDLQSALHRVYDAAGYAYYAYEEPPEPPLSGNDLEWAEEILRSVGIA